MKEQLKDKLYFEAIEHLLFLAEMNHKAKDKVAHMNDMRKQLDVLYKSISSLLEQQNKDLIEQILKDAPEDMDEDYNYDFGFNECNSQWRETLNKLI